MSLFWGRKYMFCSLHIGIVIVDYLCLMAQAVHGMIGRIHLQCRAITYGVWECQNTDFHIYHLFLYYSHRQHQKTDHLIDPLSVIARAPHKPMLRRASACDFSGALLTNPSERCYYLIYSLISLPSLPNFSTSPVSKPSMPLV